MVGTNCLMDRCWARNHWTGVLPIHLTLVWIFPQQKDQPECLNFTHQPLPFFHPLIFPLPVFHFECNGALCRGYPEHNLILNCIHSNIGWNKNTVDVKSLTSGSSRYKNLAVLETLAASYKVFLSKHGITIFWFTCGSLFSTLQDSHCIFSCFFCLLLAPLNITSC